MFKFKKKSNSTESLQRESKSESFKSILLAIFLALIFRSSIASPYKIPSGSMIPTLKIGDFIFVSKLSYGIKVPFTNHNFVNFSPPERGDVIVFVEPSQRKLDYIKRVIGVPGDKIEIKNDRLYINDKLMERTEIRDPSYLNDYPSIPIRDAATVYEENLDGVKHTMMEFSRLAENFGPETVPPGHLFMMGDNRDNSGDSRVWGFLPITNVRGRAMFIWLSLDSVNPLIRFSDSFAIPSIRLKRFGKTVI
ncbi:MAG: signal peptidase I [Proteobacteria bacterium]|jgi:signal peptidase I|nr:signal peptidase I [Pseudomonadota bacterium]